MEVDLMLFDYLKALAKYFIERVQLEESVSHLDNHSSMEGTPSLSLVKTLDSVILHFRLVGWWM